MTGLALAACLAVPALAQEGAWSVSASSKAVLAAEHAVSYLGAPPGLKADAAASATADFAVVDAVEKDGAWSWTVLPLSTGALTFTALFQGPDGKPVSAPPVRVHVGEPQLAQDADISDIKSPMRARPALWPWLLAAVLAWAGWTAWKKWRDRPRAADGAPIAEDPAVPPEQAAAEAIAALRASGLWEKDQAAYYLRLTDIMREYLEARYGEPFTAMTSAEVERLVKARAGSLSIGGSVRELLSRADLVKFARAKPGPEEGPRDAELALELIEATTPRAAVPESAA